MSGAPTAAPGWQDALRKRVRLLAVPKALGNMLFLFGFFHLYLWIQQHPQFAVTQIPALALDHWIGFRPGALGLYLSLWVYTALPVALQRDFSHLARYGLHIGLMCGLALLVFVVWPTSVSQAVGTRPGSGAFEMLYKVDTNGNALPSLHVASAVFSMLWLRAILITEGAPRWLQWASVAWCVGIVYSTLAIKQHLTLDVYAGAVLGTAAAALSLARSPTR